MEYDRNSAGFYAEKNKWELFSRCDKKKKESHESANAIEND